MSTLAVIGLVAAALVPFGVILVFGVRFLEAQSRALSSASPTQGAAADRSEEIADLRLRVAELEIKVQGLPSLWAEERERATLAKKRAEQAVRDLEAKREAARVDLESDEGDELDPDQIDLLEGLDDDELEQLAAHLRSRNEAGGQGGGVHGVRSHVDASPNADLQARAHQALAQGFGIGRA